VREREGMPGSIDIQYKGKGIVAKIQSLQSTVCSLVSPEGAEVHVHVHVRRSTGSLLSSVTLVTINSMVTKRFRMMYRIRSCYLELEIAAYPLK